MLFVWTRGRHKQKGFLIPLQLIFGQSAWRFSPLSVILGGVLLLFCVYVFYFFFKPIYITIYSWLIVFLRCALNKIARGGRPLGFTKFLYTLSVCVTVFFFFYLAYFFSFREHAYFKKGFGPVPNIGLPYRVWWWGAGRSQAMHKWNFYVTPR